MSRRGNRQRANMKTILLAYEREQDLAAVETMLQARGHRIVRARNGIEALEAIRSGNAGRAGQRRHAAAHGWLRVVPSPA